MLLRIVVEFVNKDRNKLLNPGLAQRLKRQESSQRARLLTNRTTSKREPPGRSDNKGGFCVTSVSSLALTEAPARPRVVPFSVRVNDVCWPFFSRRG